MTDISYLSNQVLDVIKATPEYLEYSRVLAELQKDSALYARVNEMREKNFNIQFASKEDLMALTDALTCEYEDVIGIAIVKEFIDAEAAFCRLMQIFFNEVTSGLEFD